MNRFRLLAAVLGTAALVGCEKNAVQTITGTDPGARIKFFNFAVATAPAVTPMVNFYAGSQKLNGVSTVTGVDTLGIGYGGVTNGAFYSALAPGQYTFTAKGARPADSSSIIATLPGTLEMGKHYSFFMSGPYNATAKTADAFMVVDDFPSTIDFSSVYVRFVHAGHNANPMTLFAKRTTTNTPPEPADTATFQIGAQVAYKSAGAFIKVPAGTYNLFSRYAGQTTNAITRATTVTWTAGRVYTVTAIGDITVATGTAARNLDNTVNR